MVPLSTAWKCKDLSDDGEPITRPVLPSNIINTPPPSTLEAAELLSHHVPVSAAQQLGGDARHGGRGQQLLGVRPHLHLLWHLCCHVYGCLVGQPSILSTLQRLEVSSCFTKDNCHNHNTTQPQLYFGFTKYQPPQPNNFNTNRGLFTTATTQQEQQQQ